MSKPKKVYRIEWVDSAGPPGYWVDASEAHAKAEQMTCDTVGWVVKKSKRAVTVASTLHMHQVGGVITIPRFAITRMARYKG